MAKQVQESQSISESRVYPIDFSDALLEDVDLIDALLTYSGDNTEDNPPTLDVTIVAPIAYISISNLELGNHKVSVVAITTRDDLQPEVQLLITANF